MAKMGAVSALKGGSYDGVNHEIEWYADMLIFVAYSSTIPAKVLDSASLANHIDDVYNDLDANNKIDDNTMMSLNADTLSLNSSIISCNKTKNSDTTDENENERKVA